MLSVQSWARTSASSARIRSLRHAQREAARRLSPWKVEVLAWINDKRVRPNVWGGRLPVLAKLSWTAARSSRLRRFTYEDAAAPARGFCRLGWVKCDMNSSADIRERVRGSVLSWLASESATRPPAQTYGTGGRNLLSRFEAFRGEGILSARWRLVRPEVLGFFLGKRDSMSIRRQQARKT